MEDSNPLANKSNSRLESLLLAFLAFLLVFVLWQGTFNNGLLYPFRLLVTFVHESGHGIAAIITGGRFEDFRVFENGSGFAYTAGGNEVLVKSMGYVGAAVFGAALLYAANRVPQVRIVAGIVGVFFIVCAVLYTGAGWQALAGAAVAIISWLLGARSNARTLLRILSVAAIVIMLIIVRSNIALMIGLVAGVLLLALAVFGSRHVTLFALNALAFMIGFNALDDLQYLLNNQSAGIGSVPNDALALANYTHTPELVWILLWIGLALLLMGAAIYWGLIRRKS
jgi:hypothetical protein